MFPGFLIDSNAPSSPLLRSEGTRNIYIPSTVIFETFKHADVLRSLRKSFGFLRESPAFVHVLHDFGRLSQHEIGTTRKLALHDIVNTIKTEEFRQLLRSNFDCYSHQYERIQQAKRRQETMPHGILNSTANREIATKLGGDLLRLLAKEQVAVYRKRTANEWLHESIDDEIVQVAAYRIRQEINIFLLRRGFPKTHCRWFIKRNPLLFRILAIQFVRRFVNEYGNTIASWENNPAQPEFANERFDIDFCAFASLFRHAVTNDKCNRICLRYLHRIMEINSQHIFAPTRCVYFIEDL